MSRPVSRGPAGGGGRPAAAGRPPEGKAPPVIAGAGTLTTVRDGQRPCYSLLRTVEDIFG